MKGDKYLKPAISEACDICASLGSARQKKNISISQVNEALNEHIQAVFTVIQLQIEKSKVLSIVDAGTAYGARSIVSARHEKTMKCLLETEWILHHGTLKKFRTDCK